MEEYYSQIFDSTLSIFENLFSNIETIVFTEGQAIFLTIITPILTLVIMFWCVKKIREGDFKIPEDIIQLAIFLGFVAFCNVAIYNYTFYQTYVIGILDIPAEYIQQLVFKIISNNITSESFTIGSELGAMLSSIFNNATNYTIPENIKIWDILSAKLLLNVILWGAYVFFSLILFMGIAMTIILNYLQIAFWKTLGIIMLPLLYFKVTRQMVIVWAKTIIALSLISTFVLFIGGLNNQVETSINSIFSNADLENEQISLGLVCAFILAKLIAIAFLKEIPAMINGMLQTNASQGTGAFANSMALGSIGMAAGASAFGALKGLRAVGGVAKNTSVGLAKTAGESSIGTAVSAATSNVASSIGNSKMANIGGNVKRGFSNITSGKSWNSGNATKQ